MVTVSDAASLLNEIQKPNTTVFIVIGTSADATSLAALATGGEVSQNGFTRVVVKVDPGTIVDDPTLDAALRSADPKMTSADIGGTTGQNNHLAVNVVRAGDPIVLGTVNLAWVDGDAN